MKDIRNLTKNGNVGSCQVYLNEDGTINSSFYLGFGVSLDRVNKMLSNLKKAILENDTSKFIILN